MIASRQGVIAKQTSFVDIILRSSRGDTENIINGYSVFYSTTLCGEWFPYPSINNCPNSKDCELYGTLTIPANTYVYITVKECDGTFIKFNAIDDSDECPANEGNYCYNYDECQGLEFDFNSGAVNKTISINVYIANGVYEGCPQEEEEEEE